MIINDCDDLVHWAHLSVGQHRFDDCQEHFDDGISAARACRNLARDELAAGVLDDLRKLPISKLKNNESRLAEEMARLKAKQRDQCATTEVQIVVPEASQQTDATSAPPIWIRGWNFATAMLRHGKNGLKMCSQEKIDRRLAICQACPKLSNNHCSLCGCACNAQNHLLNKLALETEKCPLNKW